MLGIVWIGASLAAEGVAGRFGERFPRRSWAALSIGMSALLSVMWAARIVQGLSGDVGGLLHGETTMTVQALDLGIVVPGSIFLAVLAWRRIPAAMAAATAFAVTFVTLSAAIASMLVSAWLTTGVLELPPIVIFAAATAAGLVVGLRMYRSVLPAAEVAAHRSIQTHARSVDLPATG
jgi:hypothetical protein